MKYATWGRGITSTQALFLRGHKLRRVGTPDVKKVCFGLHLHDSALNDNVEFRQQKAFICRVHNDLFPTTRVKNIKNKLAVLYYFYQQMADNLNKCVS